MPWFLYASAAAVLETFSSVIRKKLVPPPLITATFTSAVVAALGAAALFVERPSMPQPAFIPFVFLAGGLYALIHPLWVSALRLSPLSLIMPYMSLTTVFALIWGILLAGERVSWGGILGVFIVALGIFLLHAGGRDGIGAALASGFRDRGVRRMALTAFLLSLLPLSEKLAIREGGVIFTLTLESAVTATLLAFLVLGRGARPRSSSLLGILPLGGIQFFMALSIFTAYTLAPIAYALSVKRLAIPLTALTGVFFLGEREELRSRLLGGATMTAGAIAIILFGRA